MSRLTRILSLAACAALAWFAGPIHADQKEDEAAIRKSIESYTAAYNAKDAKALAGFWLPEAVYTDPETGRGIVGREAIEKHFAANFAKAKAVKLSVQVESIKFVSPHVAVEQGTASVVGLDKAPVKTQYSAVHVKREGKWHLDRVSEEDEPLVQSNYEKLKELEWMVGNWVDDDDDANIETTVKWAKNQAFLVRTYTIYVRNRIDVTGVQMIGWDPAAKRIRSWVFDSSGSFGEGTWTKKGTNWHIQNKETLENGKQATSQNIITVVGKDSFTWQSVNRQTDGVPLPNVNEVVMIRKTASE